MSTNPYEPPQTTVKKMSVRVKVFGFLLLLAAIGLVVVVDWLDSQLFTLERPKAVKELKKSSTAP